MYPLYWARSNEDTHQIFIPLKSTVNESIHSFEIMEHQWDLEV